MKLLIEEENKQIELQCSKLIEQLTKKEINLNEFTQKYIELRTTLHYNQQLLQKHN